MLCVRNTTNLILAAIFTLTLSAMANAADRRERGMDIDFDTLKGEIWRADGEWALDVRYEVEIEGRLPQPGDLMLVIRLRDRGRLMVDDEDRPFELIVPLDHPSEADSDELEFEDRFIVALPEGTLRDPGRLRLEGAIVRADGGKALDSKGSSVKFRKPSSRSNVGISLGVGVNIGWGVGVGIGFGF